MVAQGPYLHFRAANRGGSRVSRTRKSGKIQGDRPTKPVPYLVSEGAAGNRPQERIEMKLEQIINQPVIETERFDLRPLRRSDKGLIELYAGDARIARMTTSIPHPLPPGSTEAFITRATAEQRDEDVWAIDGTRTGGGELKGVISLKKLDENQSEIGYWVA